MMGLVDRALALNPNFARGWHIGGLLRVWAGQPDAAIQHLDAALRLSPRARIGTSANVIGLAHLFAGRFDQAVPKLLLAIQDDPSFQAPIAFSPPATPIWGGSTMPAPSSRGCARSRPS
jgi:tetratricopeptide (TPR) repeat protein